MKALIQPNNDLMTWLQDGRYWSVKKKYKKAPEKWLIENMRKSDLKSGHYSTDTCYDKN